MAKKLLDGALGAVSAVGSAARHIVWYLNHQVGGEPRERRDSED